MADSSIAKSGWVYRQSSFLKKWKKSWLILYQNGDLKYFHNETSSVAEHMIVMKQECIYIKTGRECLNVTPPEGLSPDFLFLVMCRNNKYWQMCGDSLDDMKAWHLALEQARVSAPRQPPAPSVYQTSQFTSSGTSVRYVYPAQQYVYYGAHPAPYMVAAPGQTTVVYRDSPHRYRRTDMAFGLLAGAAVGSMLWGPYLWW